MPPSKMKAKRTARRVLLWLVLAHAAYWAVITVYRRMLRPATRASETAHPLDSLLKEAEANWNAKVARQSKTAAQAIQEYRRRYNREPPPGFEEWFQYAKEQNALLPDEYDTLMASLEPFWAMSAGALRKRTVHMGLQDSFTLVVAHRNFTFWDEGEDDRLRKPFGVERGAGFQSLIRQFIDKPGMGTMAFAVNELAEPRVLTPWKELTDFNEAVMLNSTVSHTPEIQFYNATWAGRHNDKGTTWRTFVRTCPPGSKARRDLERLSPYTLKAPAHKEKHRPLPPKRRSDASSDKLQPSILDFENKWVSTSHAHFCDNPSEALSQGLFYSDYRNVESLAPVFSPSTAAGYADILIPSHYYFAEGYPQYHLLVKKPSPKKSDAAPVTAMDAPPEGRPIRDEELPIWTERENKIFWRGSPTGGGNNPQGRQLGYQRQRFLSMIDNSTLHSVDVTLSRERESSLPETATVPSNVLHENLFDVAFTSMNGCGPKQVCDIMKSGGYRFTKRISPLSVIKYKMALDLDGMAYSARFMALLESGAAVLKSTIFTEYFSDSIQPWYHYIPLSSTYDEVYNIFAYFLGPEQQAASNSREHTIDHSSPQGSVMGCKNLGANEARLADIGSRGRQWQSTLGSTGAMQVYLYRLLLEWSRLWSRDGDNGIGSELIFEADGDLVDNFFASPAAEVSSSTSTKGLEAAEKKANDQIIAIREKHDARLAKAQAAEQLAMKKAEDERKRQEKRAADKKAIEEKRAIAKRKTEEKRAAAKRAQEEKRAKAAAAQAAKRLAAQKKDGEKRRAERQKAFAKRALEEQRNFAKMRAAAERAGRPVS